MTQISNPNRTATGFINLGPQIRNAPTSAANWQTQGMIGGGRGSGAAPQAVSEIWNAPKAPPRPPGGLAGAQMPTPPAGFSQPPGNFGAPNSDATRDVSGLFNSFTIDSVNQVRAQAQAQVQAQAAQAKIAAQAQAQAQSASYHGLGGGGPQAAFMNNNGRAPAAPTPSQPGPSLMSMINNRPPPSAVPPYPLGNGSVPNPQAARAHAAFPGSGLTPQCSLQSGVPSSAFGGNGGNSFGAASASRTVPPNAPKTLSSTADYAAAAQQYKPPTAPRGSSNGNAQSVSRKPESAGSGRATGGVLASSRSEAPQEWECRRCTFLNNGSLWECEMCGFERPGKSESSEVAAASQSRSQDSGWQTASKRVPVAAAAATGNKPKAQNKNEKRRAKKRSDEF